MAEKTDKLTARMIYIMTQLNNGERLSTKELAEHFNVSIRVVQKDLNERISQFLPVTKKDGYYFLEEYLIGKLSYDDMRTFAKLSGIKQLYPSLEDTFLSDILNKNINQACVVRGGSYEDISKREEEFNTIKFAITTTQKLSFTYNGKHRVVNPYKLINNNNIWYLVADEDGELKNYTFTKIINPTPTDIEFYPNQELVELIKSNRLKWFSKNTQKVIVEVDSKVMQYFLRRDLLNNQVILQQTKEKLTLQTEISYDEEILSVVRYWIPHLKIVEPYELQEKLLQELQLYINS